MTSDSDNRDKQSARSTPGDQPLDPLDLDHTVEMSQSRLHDTQDRLLDAGLGDELAPSAGLDPLHDVELSERSGSYVAHTEAQDAGLSQQLRPHTGEPVRDVGLSEQLGQSQNREPVRDVGLSEQLGQSQNREPVRDVGLSEQLGQSQNRAPVRDVGLSEQLEKNQSSRRSGTEERRQLSTRAVKIAQMVDASIYGAESGMKAMIPVLRKLLEIFVAVWKWILATLDKGLRSVEERVRDRESLEKSWKSALRTPSRVLRKSWQRVDDFIYSMETAMSNQGAASDSQSTQSRGREPTPSGWQLGAMTEQPAQQLPPPQLQGLPEPPKPGSQQSQQPELPQRPQTVPQQPAYQQPVEETPVSAHQSQYQAGASEGEDTGSREAATPGQITTGPDHTSPALDGVTPAPMNAHNEPESFWSANKWIILSALAACLIGFGLGAIVHYINNSGRQDVANIEQVDERKHSKAEQARTRSNASREESPQAVPKEPVRRSTQNSLPDEKLTQEPTESKPQKPEVEKQPAVAEKKPAPEAAPDEKKKVEKPKPVRKARRSRSRRRPRRVRKVKKKPPPAPRRRRAYSTIQYDQ